MMRQARTYLFSAVTSLLLSYSMSASSGEDRGKLLYENHCIGCHASTVHIRDQRKSKNPAELRSWILRWSGELKLNWSEDELTDVYQHLNNRYYKFPLATPAK
jgi:hypothetical protein